ncbi:hypothetical protein ElP_55030 [Tautonia plasticadhaerens]|uniref:Uncharacterized protein n=2 Tax=Tautonia plasticadhaerens TaxID=2527974 RepID=A0A518H9N6_9BACT|nr:hypothetical protein ElP_55030 [Tautonia plasticadhaerens]
MVVPPPRNSSKKRQKIHTWLRKRISPLDFGFKHDGRPIHANANYEVLDKLNGGRGWLARLSNADMDAHFADEHTYYFSGNGSRKSDETLAMIDIDCHRRGTAAGAMAYAEYIRSKPLFRGLYIERSTNGVGIHGYPVIYKGCADDRIVNVALKVLDLYLKGLSYLADCDIELVEVKGLCPETTWGKERGLLKGYKSGTLAKLPREAHHRADELMGTSRVHVSRLRRLGFDLADEAEALGVPAEVVERIRSASEPLQKRTCPEHLERLREAVKGLECWKRGQSTDPTTIPVTLPLAVAGAEGRQVGDGEPSKKARGSTEAPTVSDEIAGLIRTTLLRFAKNWANSGFRSGKGRRVVPMDIATLIAVVAHTKDHPNRDGSTPTVWIMRLWKDLKERGYTDRAWDHHNYKAARDFLSRMGWLVWHDENYVVGQEVNGVFRKGQAAKWEATGYLRSIAEVEEEVGTGEDREEVEREEGHIYGQHLEDPATLGFIQRLRDESGHWKTPQFAGYAGQTTRIAA